MLSICFFLVYNICFWKLLIKFFISFSNDEDRLELNHLPDGFPDEPLEIISEQEALPPKQEDKPKKNKLKKFEIPKFLQKFSSTYFKKAVRAKAKPVAKPVAKLGVKKPGKKRFRSYSVRHEL